MGYSLGSNNSLWWLHGGDHIATRNGQTVVVADMITNLLEEKAELLEALRRLAMQMEGVIQRAKGDGKTLCQGDYVPLRQARTILAKIGGRQ